MDSILGTVTDKLDKFLPGAKQQVKQFADKAKAYMNNMTELEIKVMEATNHEPWGPHGTAMQEITNAAFTSDGLTQIMGVLDMRMAEVGDNWRLVYKSLLLLEYMVKHGPARIADALLSNRLHRLEMLKEGFEYKEPSGRDQGINVRQRAGALVALISDRERLAEERERAAKNSGKFGGVSSSQSRYGGFAGGAAAGGGGGYSSGGFDSARQGGGGGAYGGRRAPRFARRRRRRRRRRSGRRVRGV
ncbi:hypothetical protein MNEG_14314 [Monoraphidium neglectum]|uniref:ENTH domain-containing protein n=1 Tax=Monoraphidium neglectum TaxID=145388 RepID=A0A0D2MEW8_9CHLO|nr:hypothetical protein MNEG_14314 [Monoraphidium neglectum]KIY93650.1 hypothetical protein MNEG_14314 [Monoraphidium neglectum]|eukprot:XP_013892670.1 hypothetical protein MNEG_14314 [Monoraphidium neglectum]